MTKARRVKLKYEGFQEPPTKPKGSNYAIMTGRNFWPRPRGYSEERWMELFIKDKEFNFHDKKLTKTSNPDYKLYQGKNTPLIPFEVSKV